MRIETRDINKILLPRLLTLVTCNDELGGIDAMPVDTILPVSSNPSILIALLNPAFKIFKNILTQEEFVVNILPKEYAYKILNCAKNYPRGIDKLEQTGLGSYSSEKISSKRVKEAKLWIECKLANKMKVGENMVMFGEVVTIDADESIVVGGKVDIAKLNPPLRISEAIFSELQK